MDKKLLESMEWFAPSFLDRITEETLFASVELDNYRLYAEITEKSGLRHRLHVPVDEVLPVSFIEFVSDCLQSAIVQAVRVKVTSRGFMMAFDRSSAEEDTLVWIEKTPDGFRVFERGPYATGSAKRDVSWEEAKRQLGETVIRVLMAMITTPQPDLFTVLTREARKLSKVIFAQIRKQLDALSSEAAD